MGAFATDVRHALRSFTRSRGLAAVTVLILAGGVLLNTAAFGIVNAVWFRPLPIRDPDRLVILSKLPEPSRVLAEVAVFDERQMNVSRGADAEPKRVVGGAITANALEFLGSTLASGRWFTAAEAASGAPVALASAELGALGSVITIDGQARTVVGHIPPSFRFVYSGYEVFTPLRVDAPREGLQVLARLAPGVSASHAAAVLDARVESYLAAFRARHSQYAVLLAAAGIILLIVCANLSGLFVARNSARRRELAIRLAVGATRAALVRLMLLEALALAAVAGAVSLAGAFWLRSVLVASVPALEAFAVDHRVLVYTLLSCLLAAVAFGLLPALAAARDLNGSIRCGQRMRGALVVAQLAMGIMLLAGAAMLATSVRGLRAIPTGMRTDRLLLFDLGLAGPRYTDPAARDRFWSAVSERAIALPGVEDAALATDRPLAGGPREERVEIQGQAPEREPVLVAVTAADPHWRGLLGIPLLAGRTLGRESRPVALVNQAFVRRHCGERAAPASVVGSRLRIGDRPEWIEIAGVMADRRQRLDLPAFPEIVLPHTQTAPSSMTLLVRTAAPSGAIASALRREVRALDASVPVDGPADMDGIVENYYPSVLVCGLRLFAVVALALSTVGLYGLVSFLTARRSREIGIRLALGATRAGIVRTVLAFALRLIVVAGSIGLAGSFAVARVLQGSMAGVSAAAPATIAAIVLGMSGVAACAAAVPAWRASRLDPASALRQE